MAGAHEVGSVLSDIGRRRKWYRLHHLGTAWRHGAAAARAIIGVAGVACCFYVLQLSRKFPEVQSWDGVWNHVQRDQNVLDLDGIFFFCGCHETFKH